MVNDNLGTLPVRDVTAFDASGLTDVVLDLGALREMVRRFDRQTPSATRLRLVCAALEAHRLHSDVELKRLHAGGHC
jgi:hypothetical protein